MTQNVELDAVRAVARVEGMAASGCSWQAFFAFKHLSKRPWGGLYNKTPEVMSTFKDRLLEEKAQLDERRAKLEVFQHSEAFQGIGPVQMTLLNIQAQAMATYSQCLTERIAWLDGVEQAHNVMAGDY